MRQMAGERLKHTIQQSELHNNITNSQVTPIISRLTELVDRARPNQQTRMPSTVAMKLTSKNLLPLDNKLLLPWLPWLQAAEALAAFRSISRRSCLGFSGYCLEFGGDLCCCCCCRCCCCWLRLKRCSFSPYFNWLNAKNFYFPSINVVQNCQIANLVSWVFNVTMSAYVPTNS